jgi:hypothetical protein
MIGLMEAGDSSKVMFFQIAIYNTAVWTAVYVFHRRSNNGMSFIEEDLKVYCSVLWFLVSAIRKDFDGRSTACITPPQGA